MSESLISIVNKQRIAKQFSRAANAYDAAADIQLDIAFDAMALLPNEVDLAVDLGCGTGRISQRLSDHCKQVLAMDLAFGMVNYAQLNQPRRKGPICWLQGDAEQLPLGSSTIDLVYSSMALQWCQNQRNVMSEISRVLTAQGQATLAIMCDGSFNELNNSWLKIDQRKHVNTFASAQSWSDAAKQEGLTVHVYQKSYVTWHSDIRTLLGSIKSVGANVVLQEIQASSPATIKTGASLNRNSLKLLDAHYRKKYANNSQLPLTYQVCFLHCSKVKG